jgi:ferredoxin-NADP reductase
MAEKILKLLGSEEIAEGTCSFTFSKPAGFEYESGQTIDLTLIDPKDMDAEGPVRTFSLVSAPHEPELTIATRIRDSAFKRILKNAEPGTELAWDGPYGSFILYKNSSKPAVMLAGGIGITPFLSIVKTAVHKRLTREICLFHSNNSPKDSPFLSELSAIAKSTPSVQYVPTMADLDESSSLEKPLVAWNGERGFIDQNMIERYVSDLSTPIYYIAGPEGFVTAMRKMLVEANADEDNIRFEEFPGY